MKLYDYLEQGFITQGDWNCAERMLRGANEVYKLGLDESALKLAASFGGGMAIGSVCGALTGSLMAFSNMFVETCAHDSNIRPISIAFLKRCEERMGSIDCIPLKSKYSTPEKKCADVLFEAAKIFDEVAEEFGFTCPA